MKSSMKSAKPKDWKESFNQFIDRLVDVIGGISKGLSRLVFGLLGKLILFISSVCFGAKTQAGKLETAHSLFSVFFYAAAIGAVINLSYVIRDMIGFVISPVPLYLAPVFLAIAIAINYLELQPTMWRSSVKAAKAVQQFDPTIEVDESELKPKTVIEKGGSLGFRKLQRLSRNSYAIEVLIYVVWIAGLLFTLKAGTTTLMVSMLSSLFFLKAPEGVMTVANSYESMLPPDGDSDDEKKTTAPTAQPSASPPTGSKPATFF